MLYIALFLSAMIFLVLNGFANAKPRGVTSAAGWSLLLVIVSPIALAYVLGAVLFFPVVMLQCVLLMLVGKWWLRSNDPQPRHYMILSILVTIAAYTIVGTTTIRSELRYADWRERFPLESIEERVPLNRLDTNPAVGNGLLEYEVESKEQWRSHQLRWLHEKSVDNFVGSWGFGIGRMIREVKPSEHGLTNGLRTEPAPLQPSNPSYEPRSLKVQTSNIGGEGLHNDAVLDFIHPQGFGYVKDRQHVAGFQSHRFSKIPESKDVEVARLELVSLLMHKDPSVYLSDRLPQMDALKGVPTRPLDAFETEGLAALRKGEDLFVREDRMLGAIRSVKQCIACHGGERGQLLGAFTYTLRPAAK